ncbi:MAG: class I SAM-dependent methyltransferase [Aestuariivirga sp.]
MNFAPDLELLPAPTPHKQAMDRMYRLQRHIYDLTRRHYLLGREHLIDSLAPPAGGTILEVGCGTGRNLVRMAQQYPDCRVFGFDISEEMLKSATAAVARHRLTHRIGLAEGDALTFDAIRAFGTAAFDRVCFSFTLSMIPDWPAALNHARSMLTPDGELHLADFGQCEQLPAGLKTGLFAWLRMFHVKPQAGLKEALESIARQNGDSVSAHSLYRGYSLYLCLRAKGALKKPLDCDNDVGFR